MKEIKPMTVHDARGKLNALTKNIIGNSEFKEKFYKIANRLKDDEEEFRALSLKNNASTNILIQKMSESLHSEEIISKLISEATDEDIYCFFMRYHYAIEAIKNRTPYELLPMSSDETAFFQEALIQLIPLTFISAL